MSRPKKKSNHSHEGGDELATELRIIGGKFRAKKLAYEPLVQLGKKPSTDRSTLVTRPMKHRVREAIFNLVGPAVADKHAIDLFAGTGALGLEALSRGAGYATFIERHVPTAGIVRENISRLMVEEQSHVLVTSAFLWGKRDLPEFSAQLEPPVSGLPWVVFISPPYDFFIEREEEMLALIEAMHTAAPEGSMLVVEADQRFDFSKLPGPIQQERRGQGWDVREYAPAVVGLLKL